MAGSKSDWLENAALDHFLGKATTELSTTLNSTVWVHLYNSTITDAWTTTSTGECAGSTYARINVVNSSATWSNSTAGAKHNIVDLEFTTSAGADWGTVKAFAVSNTSSTATSGPNKRILYWGDLSAEQAISSGNVVRFSTGAVVITED